MEVKFLKQSSDNRGTLPLLKSLDLKGMERSEYIVEIESGNGEKEKKKERKNYLEDPYKCESFIWI